MAAARYVIGIDLGTTHCAVAASPVDRPDIRLFEVPQLTAPGEISRRTLLPSFLYLPAEGELTGAQSALPWSEEAGDPRGVVGVLARRQGARTPVRLVASAKSWICHGGVNRRAPILPWAAPDSEPRISPYEAQARYLAHLRAAWDADHPDALMTDQEVVITVPASFDDAARQLTVEAAQSAGLPEARLIEEPQAAFYDFLGAHEETLSDLFEGARLALVVDVGGGTTDLTLVRVGTAADGSPDLERIAVGGHLMLGGDNMDAALAHHVQRAAGLKGKLDPTEWAALVQSARQAKEQLLAEDAPAQAVVSIQRRGARLIGGTKSVTLTRETVAEVLLDGFLPQTPRSEQASRGGRAGLTTLGLPYTTDAAIPRHINSFLRRHATAAAAAGAEVIEGLPRPDLLLLNGGVFNAPAMIERLNTALTGWYGAPVPLLPHTSLDTAVARGAARFGLVKRGLALAITGGTARACYVGVAGAEGEPMAFCVAPRGMEEGTTVEVKDRVFDLVVDRPVSFPLFTYTGDRTDSAGALVPVDDELDALPALRTVLRVTGDIWVNPATGGVPVNLASTLTEQGALQLFLSTVELPPRRWTLEFDLGTAEAREAPQADDPGEAPPPDPEDGGPLEPLPAAFARVRRLIERTFNRHGSGADPKVAKPLRRDLEEVLGPRGQWSSRVCRALFDLLMEVAAFRGRSSVHELTWLRLAGWTMRPGFGFRGDAARVEQLWGLFETSVSHPKDKGLWSEWWIMWRRTAAGLGADQQRHLFTSVQPWLAGGKPPPGPRAHGHPEMIRMLAGLERLPAEAKAIAGQWALQRQKKVGSWWPLGRLGARVPFHGAISSVVAPEVAEGWLDRLFEEDWANAEGAAFAGVLLARATGDARRDISAERRAEVVRRLGQIKSPAHWVTLVTEAAELSASDAKAVFGDALPAGLRLG